MMLSRFCGTILLAVILAGLSVSGGCATAPSPPTSSHSEDRNSRTVLKVVLYPFIPEHTAFFYDIKRAFEKENASIDLQIIDLKDNYYDCDEAHAITNTQADVYELDSVFLADFVKGKKLQPLPPVLRPSINQFLQVAEEASQFENDWYGVPHWACTNFLFFKTGDALASVKRFSDIERLLGNPHALHAGLLMDAKGKSTLGELYLDALIDGHETIEKAEPFLNKDNMDPASVGTLRKAVALCDPGFCRDSDYHAASGFYARRFARMDGRALIGYSERLYYAIDEGLNSCKKANGMEKECLKRDEIDFVELPLADSGSRPFAWVDLLAISSSCIGQCLNDATKFIAFVTKLEEVKKSLIPEWGTAPRYLLPAHVSLYNDPAILKEAPLYPRMLEAIERAVPVTGVQLNSRLRQIGKELDKKLPAH